MLLICLKLKVPTLVFDERQSNCVDSEAKKSQRKGNIRVKLSILLPIIANFKKRSVNNLFFINQFELFPQNSKHHANAKIVTISTITHL